MDNRFVQCLGCGSRIHGGWDTFVCESCLAGSKKIGSEKDLSSETNSLKEALPDNDQRKTQRIGVKKTFLYDGFLGTIQNISRGGIQVKTKRPLSVGETLTIALAQRDSILKICATVVHVRSSWDESFLAGAEFLEIAYKNSPLRSPLLKRHLNQRTQLTD